MDSLVQKWIVSLTTSMLIVPLVGCGSKPDTTTRIEALPKSTPTEPVVTVPTDHKSDEVAKSMKDVRAAYDFERRQFGRFKSRTMYRTMSQTSSQLPEIPVGHKNQPSSWAKVSLNTAKLGFDAVCFSNPLPNADVVFAIAQSEEDASRVKWWGINSAGSPMAEGVLQTHVRHNVGIPELPLGNSNTVTFVYTNGQLLHAGDRNNIIGFVIEGEDPMDVYLKLVAHHAHEAPKITKSSEAASALGLVVPLPLTSAATAIDHATAISEEDGEESALSFLQEKLTDDHPWESWHQYLHMSSDYFTKLIESGQVEEASSLALRTAPGVRWLRDESIKPNGLQCDLIPVMLYNVACALAEDGKASDAVSTLREAVDAGFSDGSLMRGDDSLLSLHDNAEFKRLISELEKR